MATSPTSTVSERLQRDAMQVLESTIPVGLTLDEWRRLRPRATRRRLRRSPSRTPHAPRHLTLVPDVPRDQAYAPPPLAA